MNTLVVLESTGESVLAERTLHCHCVTSSYGVSPCKKHPYLLRDKQRRYPHSAPESKKVADLVIFCW